MKGVLGLVVLILMVSAASGDLAVTCEGANPSNILDALLGSGITVSNIQYTGSSCSAGTFSGGTGIIGLEDGIILSSGDINYVKGPNTHDGITAELGLPGDAALNNLIPGFTTNDATILEFDFVPTSDVLTFDYVFTSDEYNEYVNSVFNDVFGFFLNGVDVSNNIALIPGTTTPVSINNVNGGNPLGTDPSNEVYYINNDLNDGGGSINTEMDGLTTVFTATAYVNKGVSNHIKLAIADAGDLALDSNVFISDFQSLQITLAPLDATNYLGEDHELTAKLVDPEGRPIPDVTVNFAVTGVNTARGTALTDELGIATWSYRGTNEGMDTIVATATVNEEELTSNLAYKTWEMPPATAIKVDIKPGLCPNLFNPSVKGVIPIAILGTEEFDVTNIDLTTIGLSYGGNSISPMLWCWEDVAKPFEGKPCNCRALGPDGRLDLHLKFSIQEMDDVLNLPCSGDVMLTIYGNLKEELGIERVEGQDCIRISPPCGGYTKASDQVKSSDGRVTSRCQKCNAGLVMPAVTNVNSTTEEGRTHIKMITSRFNTSELS
jgi:hypothetical protein